LSVPRISAVAPRRITVLRPLVKTESSHSFWAIANTQKAYCGLTVEVPRLWLHPVCRVPKGT